MSKMSKTKLSTKPITAPFVSKNRKDEQQQPNPKSASSGGLGGNLSDIYKLSYYFFWNIAFDKFASELN